MIKPACWSWPVPPLRTMDAEIARVMSTQADLPPNKRLSRAALEMGYEGSMSLTRFVEFHAGAPYDPRDSTPARCAMCGERPFGLLGHVDDHDHATGLLRGRLCRSCNTVEGRSRREIVGMYRQRNPATILGVKLWYTSVSWPVGWWENTAYARRLTGNPDWMPVEGAEW